jgi:hypothetical protein
MDHKMKESMVLSVPNLSQELKETTQTISTNYCLDQLTTGLHSVPKVCICDDDDEEEV